MTSLVIPIAPSLAPNETLPWAVRSARYALPELRTVLVGAPLPVDELWADRVIRYEQNSADPVTNTTAMLEAACYDSAVTDPFVWSNDDIFWRRPVVLLDVYRAGLTARGFLSEIMGTDTYAHRAEVTRAQLVLLGRPQWNYERHVPMLVHKDYMRNALRQHRDGAIRSFYANLYHDDPKAMEPDVKAWDLDEMRGILAGDPAWLSVGDDFPVTAVELELLRAWTL